MFMADEAQDGSGSGDGPVRKQHPGEIDDDEDGHDDDHDDDEGSGGGSGWGSSSGSTSGTISYYILHIL